MKAELRAQYLHLLAVAASYLLEMLKNFESCTDEEVLEMERARDWARAERDRSERSAKRASAQQKEGGRA